MAALPKITIAALAGLLAWSAAGASERGRVEFESSNTRLNDGFRWAKTQALRYVFSGDAAGEWYEASLPGRSAFCMRDVSHQALGAQVLGLAPVTRNLLRRFANSIAGSRQWCGFWEITKDGLPAPVDYKDDRDFWYNLPANFDVLHACYRQYLWTAGETYRNDPIFRTFYRRTTTDYIRAWDADGDGIPDSFPGYGRRGIGSYFEASDVPLRQGVDLVAAEYAALLAASRMSDSPETAVRLRDRAAKLKRRLNRDWWDASTKRFYAGRLQDGRYSSRAFPEASVFPLYFESLPSTPEHREGALRALVEASRDAGINVEALSYMPEVLFRWGHDDDGYRVLLHLLDPSLPRREYPEVSFAAVGAIVAGLMGIAPEADHTVATLAHLTPQTEWAAVRHVPVFQNEIGLRHQGLGESSLTNERGGVIHWKAVFSRRVAAVKVNGVRRTPRAGEDAGGRMFHYVLVDVRPGETVTVVSTAGPEKGSSPRVRMP
jgi:hypothetical protein